MVSQLGYRSGKPISGCLVTEDLSKGLSEQKSWCHLCQQTQTSSPFMNHFFITQSNFPRRAVGMLWLLFSHPVVLDSATPWPAAMQLAYITLKNQSSKQIPQTKKPKQTKPQICKISLVCGGETLNTSSKGVRCSIIWHLLHCQPHHLPFPNMELPCQTHGFISCV